MKPGKLEVGEIVQLSPENCGNMAFAGALMVVSEPKAWGAQGYVQALGIDRNPGGQAYYRAKWEEMERTGGRPFWIVGGGVEEDVLK